MQKTKAPDRILARRLAKTLTKEQLKAIAGGAVGLASTTSCSPCADDCDTQEN